MSLRLMLSFWVVIAGALPGPVHAQAAPANTAAACASFLAPDTAAQLAQVPDAPTTILRAQIIAPVLNMPEICLIEGQISPQVGFMLRMPTSGWNGKFLMGGCGGPCGMYLNDRIDPALARRYAVVTTDMGHKGSPASGWGWAYNNLPAQIDFAFRATHVTAVVAKELVATFYNQRAAHNYFMGCSTGGRQAMVSAQRFPEDFDGIIAGAPVWKQLGNGPYFGNWNADVNIDAKGEAILHSEKLALVHAAVMKSCDAKDGLVDGILQDPRKCGWQPKEIQCKAGAATENCLTAAEVGVVEKIYDGARNGRGEHPYFGMPRGSEDQWAGMWIPAAGQRAIQMGGPGPRFVSNYLAYMGFFYASGPGYSVKNDFDIDRDSADLAGKDFIFSPSSSDLRRFKALGHKLIMYAGWNDNNIPAAAAADYYETTTRFMGGAEQTRDFYRFFMPPAVNHCRGGDGGGEIDWLTALENWVEKSQAPDQVIAYRPKKPYETLVEGTTHDPHPVLIYLKLPSYPLNPDFYDTARPVYAYPGVARYSGKGDPKVATSWVMVPP